MKKEIIGMGNYLVNMLNGGKKLKRLILIGLAALISVNMVGCGNDTIAKINDVKISKDEYNKIASFLYATGYVQEDKNKGINNNILSLIVKANLKEGGNPERVIIKTYNYDLEKNAEVSLNDIISNKQLKKEDIENKIKEEIKNKKDYENTLIQLGYETYNRNSNDDMYKTENINNFILGENGRLYIIFAYGNKTYTSETDMIIIE